MLRVNKSLFETPTGQFAIGKQRRHLGGLGGHRPPQEKEKRKKERKKRKKRKKDKKEKKKGTMNNVKLLHTKCCFFPIFQ